MLEAAPLVDVARLALVHHPQLVVQAVAAVLGGHGDRRAGRRLDARPLLAGDLGALVLLLGRPLEKVVVGEGGHEVGFGVDVPETGLVEVEGDLVEVVAVVVFGEGEGEIGDPHAEEQEVHVVC